MAQYGVSPTSLGKISERLYSSSGGLEMDMVIENGKRFQRSNPAALSSSVILFTAASTS